MEKVITCPVCFNTDQCFEEVQETFSSYLCFKCGFMSDSRYKIGSLKLTESLKKSPKLVVESKFEDEGRGMIFPEGDSTDYVWKYAKVIDIPEEERALYDNHTQRLDVDNAETYGKYEFLKACESMGITRKMSNG